MLLLALSSRASQPIAQSKSGDEASNSFVQPGQSHFTVCFELLRDRAGHHANRFADWECPLLSKFRFSRTSIALIANGANSICFLCRGLDRLRRRGNAGLRAISACRT
jgi:hypothetical protein